MASSNLILNLSKKKNLSNYIEFNQRNSLAKLCMYILTYVLYGQESEIWHKIEKTYWIWTNKSKNDHKSPHNH